MPPLTHLRARVTAAYKAFWGNGNWVDSSLPGNRSSNQRYFWTPGSKINWDSITGDLYENAAGLACIRYVTLNYNQAPSIVQTPSAEGKLEPVPNAPVLSLLKAPNTEYNGDLLNYGLLLSLLSSGDAYINIERDKGGKAAEFWWLPHHLVNIQTRPGSKRFIDYYEYRAGGEPQIIEPENMIHLRFGLDPGDMRHGLSPYAAMIRQRYTMEQCSTYRAAILKNKGSIGGIASPSKDATTTDFDVDVFMDTWNAMHVGSDNAGSLMATNVPINLQILKNSPADMGLETMEDKPEADICAVLGVPPQCVNLHVGRLSKTYANAAEARENFWECTEIPLMHLIDGQLTPRLQEEGLLTPVQTLGRDLSAIRPLQPDLDKLHARVREDWKADLIDRATYKRLTNQKVEKDDEKLYYSQIVPAGASMVVPTATEDAEPNPAPVPAKPASNGNAGRQAGKEAFLLRYGEQARERRQREERNGHAVAVVEA